ncbi:MAG: sigma-54-dependent Fis family transcriptional regulator [Candidatus Krumholzibacteriota bacterium]|nr:sigma-54-dependent Fis family transcriptional regulator [Candidatus Krumholzibacteriota bacterium]
MKKILVVDDDTAVTNYLLVFLMQSGIFEPTVLNDSGKVIDLISGDAFDIILLDMDMPVVSGMDILNAMHEKDIQTPVVVLTGVSDVDLAVKAMKLGAFDYLIKPVDDDKLLEVLDNALEHSVLNKTIGELPSSLSRDDLTHSDAFALFQTQDPGMIRLFHQAENIASSDLSIFIWGESGTGKEALARAIHRASPRLEGPFVALEADSQNAERFSAFFFGQAPDYSGHRAEAKGLLEEADQGTIFLNSVDALTLPMQVRLKRVIQRGEYYRESSARVRKIDVRMIVSSTLDLTQPQYRDKFSQDLLYHLMINSIRIPPLRERIGDLPLLSEQFLREEMEKCDKEITGFSDEFMEFLRQYSFPDNVRELQTIIAGAVAKAETEVITAESLPRYIIEGKEPVRIVDSRFVARKLEDVIREHIQKTLRECGGDKDLAAEVLGVTRDQLEGY